MDFNHIPKKRLNTLKLQQAIENSRFSRSKLAKRCGCTRHSIDNIINGKDPHVSLISTIAEKLGFTLGYFLDEYEGIDPDEGRRVSRLSKNEELLYEGISREEGYRRHISYLEERIKEKGEATDILMKEYRDLLSKVILKRQESSGEG